MAGFVDCSKYSKDQEALDKRIDTLDECCKNNSKKNTDQDVQIKKLGDAATTADGALLDKSGNNGSGAGKITVQRIKDAVAGDVEISVNGSAGIIGNGTKNNPVALKVSSDFGFNANGELISHDSVPQKANDLNELDGFLRKLGTTYFYGTINNVGAPAFVKGVPTDFESTDNTVTSAAVHSQLGPNQDYDFNGYQIASSVEVIQYVMNNGVVWQRTNDGGMKLDGTLNNPNGWSAWKKETNVNITLGEFNALKQRAAGLEGRATALENALNQANAKIQELKEKNEESCKVPVKSLGAGSHYTLTDADHTIIIHSGSITIPDSIESGRIFTIIQSGDGHVQLLNSGKVQLHPPFEGTSVMAGERAIVSLIYEIRDADGTQHVQIAGQVEPA